MRLTVKTILAVRTLTLCAAHEGETLRKAQIAEACDASKAHLGLVINQLAQTGYIKTIRGRRGGLRLARPADEIDVGQVFRDFESEFPISSCFTKRAENCPSGPECALKRILAAARDSFFAAMDGIPLSDLVDGKFTLENLLGEDALV
ncbi:Rrf2 family transcriptional regulator [Vannielia sp.]|uniref:RrF2 family transcriptional regulator n=1 Tax=Vannielia sp. TaxID=2813045 RepID=UPI002621A959|nr:Rrf2 family transcriptional regulator [Vannielia sp.]MDF1872709.1 Rrf2 family transcriptional regulator [Vannielia sp.]